MISIILQLLSSIIIISCSAVVKIVCFFCHSIAVIIIISIISSKLRSPGKSSVAAYLEQGVVNVLKRAQDAGYHLRVVQSYGLHLYLGTLLVIEFAIGKGAAGAVPPHKIPPEPGFLGFPRLFEYAQLPFILLHDLQGNIC
jgi:hypothetical protein